MPKKKPSSEEQMLDAWATLGIDSELLAILLNSLNTYANLEKNSNDLIYRLDSVDGVDVRPLRNLLEKSIPLVKLEERLKDPAQVIWTPYDLPFSARTLIPDGPELEMGNPYPEITDCDPYKQIAVWNSEEKRWEFNQYFNFNHPDNEGEKEKEIIARYPKWKPLGTAEDWKGR